MGKTRRLVRKVRKSIRNKKSRKSMKKSIRRRRSKKMRGGGKDKEVEKFVNGFVIGSDIKEYLLKTNNMSFDDNVDFINSLNKFIENNNDDFKKNKAEIIRDAFIEECNNDNSDIRICWDQIS